MYPAAQEIADALAPNQNKQEKTPDADDVH